MSCLFVSHQWLGRASADPYGQQLGVLRNALRYVISGQGKVQTDAVFFVLFRRVLELSAEEIQQLAKGYIWSEPHFVVVTAAWVAHFF